MTTAQGAALLSDQEFLLIRGLFERETGIHLTPAKKVLVASRLRKRVAALSLPSFSAYYRLITQPQAQEEKQRAVDLLTTNETYFFRETRHFDFLQQEARSLRREGQALRVWSAACSSGEEVYSIAMVLAEQLGVAGPWELLGSDISRDVLQRAARGLYPMTRLDAIPPALLKRYCLRGTGPHENMLLIEPALARRARFAHINLMRPIVDMAPNDIIFLRNVLIYFDAGSKQQILRHVLQTLRPGGLLMIGHSESLHGLGLPLQQVTSAIYRKTGHEHE